MFFARLSPNLLVLEPIRPSRNPFGLLSALFTSNMSNFAPYQDTAPDIVRSFSPPLTKSPSPRPQIPKIAASALSPPSSPSYQNDIAYFNPERAWERSTPAQVESSTGFWRSRSAIDLYETSLGIRLDWEACLAYLGLPPAGPVALLMFEHRSDYVRYGDYLVGICFVTI